jgi:hypothetical protein
MMAIYLPTFVSFHLLVGTFYGVPIVDAGKFNYFLSFNNKIYIFVPLLKSDSFRCVSFLGKSKISPELRRKVSTVASMVARCAYCSAHYCGIGDAYKGSVNARKQPPPLKLLPGDITENERVCLKMVVNAVKIPARVTPEMRAQVLKTYGQAGLETIAAIVGFTGFTNTNADCQGTELTVDAQEIAKKTIAPFGWINEYFKTRKGSKWVEQDKKTKDDVAKGLKKPLWNTGGFFNLLLATKNAGKINDRYMIMIPKKVPDMHKFIIDRMGFLPRYLEHWNDPAGKRVLINSMFQLILGQAPKPTSDSLLEISPEAVNIPQLPADKFVDPRFVPVLNAHIKVVLGFVFFASCDNAYMAAHFAKIAQHMKIPATVLRKAMEIGGNWANFTVEQGKTKFVDAVTVYTFLTARRQRADAFPLSEKLVDLENAGGSGHQPVMEIVGLLSLLSFLQRYTVIFNDDTLDIEAEVKAVTESDYGETLGLKGIYLGANSKEFATDTAARFANTIVGTQLGNETRTQTSTQAGDEPDNSKGESVWGGNVKY